jgi:hypothetical protein
LEVKATSKAKNTKGTPSRKRAEKPANRSKTRFMFCEGLSLWAGSGAVGQLGGLPEMPDPRYRQT